MDLCVGLFVYSLFFTFVEKDALNGQPSYCCRCAIRRLPSHLDYGFSGDRRRGLDFGMTPL
jgi:hypothetical protein